MINFNSKYQKNNIEEKIKLTLQYKKKKKSKLNPIDIIIYIYVYRRIEWNKINKSWKNRVKWIKIWVFFLTCWEFTKWVRKLNKYKILSLYHSVFICCFLDKDKINTPLSFHKNKGMCALSTLKRNV